MSLIAFGETGQVARELARLGVRCFGRAAADLGDPQSCAALIARTECSGVINAAAYTAVDKAETEEALATTVNGVSPGAMAQACVAKGVPFVHISTDYVFDGSGTEPWPTNAPVAPLGAYGRTKLAGERAVKAAGGTYAILRTSWVFSAHGSNFVKTMLRLGAERDRLTIVADQVGGPTPARAIAETCVTIAEHLRSTPNAVGTYHYSGASDVSWASFARAIFQEAAISCDVVDIPSSDYPTPAARPLNSRLDCSRTKDVFGIDRPDWRHHMRGILLDLKKPLAS